MGRRAKLRKLRRLEAAGPPAPPAESGGLLLNDDGSVYSMARDGWRKAPDHIARQAIADHATKAAVATEVSMPVLAGDDGEQKVGGL